MTLISVCATAVSSCASSVFDARACPNERVYTGAEQRAMLAALPKTPPIVKQAMVDYGKLRDKARACRGER